MVQAGRKYRFGEFLLDVPNRRLLRNEVPVELTARYFDALVLLVREHGQLVEKDRLFSEVWRGVIVSDSALTQCIKEIRKQLGDGATAPRYVETVPRYGYRFVAQVEVVAEEVAVDLRGSTTDGEAAGAQPPQVAPDVLPDGFPESRERSRLLRAVHEGVAGTLGGGMAGLLGGTLYGVALASTSGGAEAGTLSTLLVFISLGVFIGVAGGFGVSCGMAAAGLIHGNRRLWSIVGAAAGGMVIGGIAKLLGLDAFNLLLGHAPTGITGAMEGAALGGAIALGAQLGGGLNAKDHWRPVVGAGLAGAVVGVLIPLAGGQLLGGSLELLVGSFSDSKLQLDALGSFFGESGFGATTEAILGGFEALLFGACVVGGAVLARNFATNRMILR